MVQRPDGELCQDATQALDVWIDFFRAMEGGTRMTAAELHRHWCEHLASVMCTQAWQAPLASIPSLTDLEVALRRVKGGKATGPDHVPSEACRHHVPAFAPALYGQVLKLLVHSQESLVHKGGYLVTAFKGKGAMTLCSSFRSLLISSHIGKAVHRTVRQCQYQIYEDWLYHTQIGGRKAFPVGAGVHILRSYMRWKASQGDSFAIIFIDLQEAFYRLLRPLVLQGGYSDATLAALIERFKLPASSVQDLRRHLCEAPVVHRAGLAPHYCRALAALHQNTWFQMQGQEDYTRTEVRSRPGDSFADIIFGYLFAHVLKDIHKTLHDRGLLDLVPIAAALGPWLRNDETITWEEFTGVTWMDDTCLCLSSPKAPELIPKLGEALSILLDTFRGCGLTPNLSPGKTEILLSVRGAGSREMRWTYFGPQQGQQLPVICEDGVHFVRIVREYKHLGGRVTHKGTDTQEMRQRISMAHSTYNEHRRLLFNNPNIPWKKRAELFEMLVLSKLAYGSESWSIDQQASGLAFHHAVLRLYKRLLRVPHDAHRADDDILREAGLPSPTTLLRRARLRYLGTLYRCCTPYLWSILRLDQAWQTLIRADLVWLWHQLRNASSLPDPDENSAAWLDLIHAQPRYWKKLVNRGVQHEILQIQNQEEIKNMHQTIAGFLGEAGFPPAPPTFHDDLPPDVCHGCLTCGIACRSKGGEGAHMFRCHQICAPERRLMCGTQCSACLREYHTTAKLQAHLRHSQVCRRRIIARRDFHEPAPGIGSQASKALDRQHDGALPVRQAQGPQRDDALGPDLVAYDPNFVQHLLERFVDIDLTATSIDAEVRATVAAVPISWTTFRVSIAHLCDTLLPEDAVHMGITLEDLCRALRELCHPRCWPFLLEPKLSPKEHRKEIADWEQHFANLAMDPALCQYMAAVERIPRNFGQHRYVLHVFSGRRRPGDVEWFLDRLRAQHATTVLHIVSLDIVIHRVFGDVSNPRTRETWYHGVRNQWIVGFLAGPPCETWSHARAHALDEDKEPKHGGPPAGPRVIREADQPWGKFHLRVREIRQLLTSNILMRFTLEMATLTVIFGGSGLVEHPAPPGEVNAASIWRQPVMHFLSQLPCTQWLQIDQGKLGAASKKPTALLAIRLPSLSKQIKAWELTVQNPSATSIGRDALGRFRTAPLKEYAPAFCCAIALGFSDAVFTIQ
eukprot:Skav211395  [mRNA]  locus=scaffold1467:73053:76628:- [translate_table: standard]